MNLRRPPPAASTPPPVGPRFRPCVRTCGRPWLHGPAWQDVSRCIHRSPRPSKRAATKRSVVGGQRTRRATLASAGPDPQRGFGVEPLLPTHSPRYCPEVRRRSAHQPASSVTIGRAADRLRSVAGALDVDEHVVKSAVVLIIVSNGDLPTTDSDWCIVGQAASDSSRPASDDPVNS